MHVWYGSVAEEEDFQDTFRTGSAQCVSLFMLRVWNYLHYLASNCERAGDIPRPARSHPSPAISGGC